MSSRHGSASPRQGYVSSVVPAVLDLLVQDLSETPMVSNGESLVVFPDNKVDFEIQSQPQSSCSSWRAYTCTLESAEAESKLLISDTFKRSDQDNLGIQRKKIASRQQRKQVEKRMRRDQSRERGSRFTERSYSGVEELAIEIEEETSHRQHSKRIQRARLRQEHAELMKWKERHAEYMRTLKKDRRNMRVEMLDGDDDVKSLLMDDEKETGAPALVIQTPVTPNGESLVVSPDNTENLIDGLVQEVDQIASRSQEELDRALLEIWAEEENERPDERDFNDHPDFSFRVPEMKVEKIFKKPSADDIKAKWKKSTRVTRAWLKDRMQDVKDYGTSLMDTPAFKSLKELFVGDSRKSRLFGIIVSTVSFMRLAVVIPQNFVDLNMLCWLHLKACGFANDVSAIGSIAVSTFSTLLSKMIAYFVDYHQTNGMKVESYGASIDGFLSGTHNFLSHPLIKAVRNVVIFLAALHIFEKPVAGGIFKHLGKPEGFSFIELIMTALKDISTMIRQGEAWLFGKPGTIDLFGENPLTSAIATLQNKLDCSEYVYTGLPVEGYVERNVFINELRDANEALEAVIKLSAKSDVRRLKADVLLREGKKKLCDFTGAASASFRATPLGVIICGPPGIGKSHVLKFVTYIHSLVKGRDFNEESIYTRTGEFWEGYMPFSHPYIHYSETGKMKKSQALAKGDEIIDELLSVIDNLSYPVNMAFKDKGKIFALPEMVLIDTNNASLNFDELYENPAAFRRRFIYIEPIVKAEYSKTGKAGGDFNTEAKGAEDAGTDAWVFNVYRMTPVDNKKSVQQVLMTAGSSENLVDLLVPLFAKHIKYEEEMLKRIGSGGLFTRHEDQILKAASLAGCFRAGKAKVLDDGSVQIHPDSVYAKFLKTGEGMKAQVSQAFNRVKGEIFKGLEAEGDDVIGMASALNHADAVASINGDAVSGSSEDAGFLRMALDSDDDKSDVVAPTDRFKLLRRQLNMKLDLFMASAPFTHTLQDFVELIIEEFNEEEITAYCRTLGMNKSHKVVIDREKKIVELYAARIFSNNSKWDKIGNITTTVDTLKLDKMHIFNLIIERFNGWKALYDAWHFCKKKENEVVNRALDVANVEFTGMEEYALWTFLSGGYYLWIVAFFFMLRIMFNQNLTMSLDISHDRKLFLLFSVLCIYMKQYGVWIAFMAVFMSCLHVQDNLRVQGLALLDRCIADGLDGLGFSYSKVQSKTTGVPDNTPKRNFWKLKAVGMFCGSALACLATVQVLSNLAPKKRPIVFNEAAPANSININVVNDSDKNNAPVKCVYPASEEPMKSQSTFSKMSVHDSELLELEKSYHCGQSIERVPNKLDVEKWNVRVVPPPVYTGKVEEFIKVIGYNCRACVALDPVLAIQREGHVLGLWDNYALVHKHAFHGSWMKKTLLISCTGYNKSESTKLATLLDETSVRELSNDLLLVRCNQIRFSNILKFLPDFKDLPNITHGYVGVDQVVVQKDLNPLVLEDQGRPVQFQSIYSYVWNRHAPGRCGTPLVGQTGKGWVLLGIHSAGSETLNNCCSSIIVKSEVLAASADMESKSLLCPLASADLQFVTEPGNAKSVTRFVEMHGCNYFGKLPGPVVMPSPSKVAKTPLYPDIIHPIFADVLDHEVETIYGPPPMKGFWRDGQYYDPDVRFASKVAQQKQPMERKILDRCIAEYVSHILEFFKKNKRDYLQPWDIDTAINGAVNDVYARAMDLSKAAGFGRTGKKKEYFDVMQKDTGKWAEMIEALRGEVLVALRNYGEGSSNGVFFEACLKDEPRDIKKCQIGKTRTFCVSPLVNLIVTRMFFGPIFSTMVEQGEVFCAAIGLDMHRYAEDMYNRLAGFSDKIMELDYGNYDQTMPYELGWASGSVVYQVCRNLGYSPQALKVVSGLVSDNLHPFVILKKDVFELPGYQPSGKYGTAEDNSVRGVLMLMYVWYTAFEHYTRDMPFFKYVLPYVYGDDVLCAVHSKAAHFFNNITYSEACEKLIGLECTPASKGAAFTPFVELGTMMFLKRRFRKHAEFDTIVAPLDLDSLVKTLTWHIPSGSISVIEQTTAALESVIRELFFHCDRKQFAEMSTRLYDHAEEVLGIQGKIKRLSFDFIASSVICSTSRSVVEGRQNSEDTDTSLEYKTLDDVKCLSEVQVATPAVKVKSACLTGNTISSSEWCGFEGTSKRDITLMIMAFREDLKWKEEIYEQEPDLDLYAVMKSLRETIVFLEDRLKTSEFLRTMEVESGEVEDIKASDMTMTQHENLRDVSGDTVDEEARAESFLNFALKKTDVDLERYLARPQLIASGVLNLDTPFALNLDVYNQLLRNPDIRSKLRTFGFFRASLKVRLTISATVFHQGRIIMGWIPWYNRCPSAQQAMTYVGDTYLPTQYMSTLSHQKTIDLKSNKPAELYIPYMHVQPMCRLFNNSNLVISDVTDFADFVDIGRLFIRSINVPEAVSATATAPYYQVYAWFEEIDYTMVTGTKMTLALESDERKTGPIEKAASSAVKIFDALARIPAISHFAMSSRTMAQGVQGLASHLGWSKPSLIQDPHRMRNEPFTCAANTIGGDLSHRLTLDPKQEISIDPSPLAVAEDELTFASLCRREQLLDTADWTTGATTMVPFWTAAVHPRLARKSAVDNTMIPSPMALVSSYFGYWHGDITFRFDVVKTSFHKGKFAIFWDPNFPQRGLITAGLKLHSEYFYIVDIQELDNLEVTVKWSFPQAWAAMPSASNATKSVGTIGAVSPNFGLRSCNGFISIVPITSLQSPLDKSVHINVYIKSENMHFNLFTDKSVELPWVFAGLLPEPEEDLSDMKIESNDVGELKPVSIVINTAAREYKGISQYHFGEEPHSVRSVLKRFRTFAQVSQIGGPVVTLKSSIIPPLDPPVGTIVPLFRDGGFLGVWRRCFVGMKGGFKYRIRPILKTTESLFLPASSMSVSLNNPESTQSNFVVAGSADSGNLDMKMIGSTAFVPYMQSGIEFDAPFYSSSLFHFAQTDNPLADASYVDPNQVRNWTVSLLSPSTTPVSLVIDAASGEDFMLMHFLSSPMMTIS